MFSNVLFYNIVDIIRVSKIRFIKMKLCGGTQAVHLSKVSVSCSDPDSAGSLNCNLCKLAVVEALNKTKSPPSGFDSIHYVLMVNSVFCYIMYNTQNTPMSFTIKVTEKTKQNNTAANTKLIVTNQLTRGKN